MRTEFGAAEAAERGGAGDILRPLSAEETEELLALYRNKYGAHDFHYLLMYNQSKWNGRLREMLGADGATTNVTDRWISFRKMIYTHRGSDFRKYGTYVSLHYDTLQSVSFHSWQPGYVELLECLRETQRIAWHQGPLLTNVDLPLCEPVKLIAATKGATVQRARRCFGLIMNHQRALHLEVPSLPDGYKIEALKLSYGKPIHEAWTNKKEGSLNYIEGLIRINQTAGIFRPSDGALVAWVIQNDFSGLGFLHVHPEEQRRGFGSIVAMYLCKKIAQCEEVALSAWIVVDNFKSEALLQKIGLAKTVVTEWIQLKGSQ